MQWQEILAMTTSAIGGGLLTQVGNYLLKKRAEDRSDLALVINNLKEDNDRLRKEIGSAKELINNLEYQNTRNQAHLIALNAGLYNHPWPAWIKDASLDMIIVNPAYERVFLKPIGKTAKDYENKKDFDIWPEKQAQEYTQHDLWVIRHKKPWEGVESVVINGVEELWYITKYPLIHEGVVIGVAGMAVPLHIISKYIKS